jgi:hypothetical protein
MRSKTASVLFATVLCAALAALPAQAQTCVTFGPPPALGTTYAPPAFVNGSLAFTQNGIPVRLYNFRLSTGPFIFNRAYIDNAPFPFGSGQSIRTNNVNLQFDFTGLPFRVRRVKLAFLDLGGYENLSVNGSNLYVGELTAAPAALNGVGVSVSASPLPPPLGGKTGSVVLTGNVQTLRIGGQELWIDEVCAM